MWFKLKKHCWRDFDRQLISELHLRGGLSGSTCGLKNISFLVVYGTERSLLFASLVGMLDFVEYYGFDGKTH